MQSLTLAARCAAAVVLVSLLVRPVAAHSILADAPENQAWHAPATSNEAVFVGTDKTTPALVIKKSAIQGQSCTMTINADGRWCIIRCGTIQLPLELAKPPVDKSSPDVKAVLKLDGASEQPGVFINGKEVMAAKGKWIQICASKANTFSMELTGATYANVKFGGGSDAGAIDAEAGAAAAAAAGAAPPAAGHESMMVILARAKHGVFHLIVKGDGGGGKPLRTGTAFLIDASGKAVTNYHVIQGGLAAEASAAGHDDQKLKADLLGVLPDYDLALVQIHVENSANVDVFPLDLVPAAPKDGANVFGLGFTESGYTINRGVVKGIRKFGDMPDDMRRALQSMATDSTWVQTDCTVDAGTSGGPLVDDHGRVVGVNTWHWMEAQGNYFAISAAHIEALLAKANSSPVSFGGDKSKFAVGGGGGSGYASTHGIPADLPQLPVTANIKPQQMVQAAIAYRTNGLKICPVCSGKGEITSHVKTGENRGGGYVQSTYRDSTTKCPTCNGTGRVHAVGDALDHLTQKLLSSIAGADTSQPDYADRLQAVANILAENLTVDRDAQSLYTKDAMTAFPLGSTKTGRAFVVAGRLSFTEPMEKIHGQLYAISADGKTVLLTNPRIADVAEGDTVVAGGIFAGRAGSDSNKMPVLQDGFLIRAATGPR